MMILPQFADNPFQIKLSFHKLIERFEEIAASGTGPNVDNAKALLAEIEPYPELKEGITSITQIENNATVIAHLLSDIFPAALSKNEIKAVSIPYLALTFNYSERFTNILQAAGTSFDFNIRDFDDHQFYIMSCCIILNQYYGTHLDFGKPLFYDIPTADGIIKHYRILYNADFLEIIPTEKSVQLSKDDIDLLINNYNNLALWKEKFPVNSWILKGFGIMTLFDVTVENAVSILKTNLLSNAPPIELQENLQSIFRSIFRIPDLHIGFTSFDTESDEFTNATFGPKIHSFILEGRDENDCKGILQKGSYKQLIKDQSYLAVSDLKAYAIQHPESQLTKHFIAQNIQSLILAPVVKNGVLLGILELVSKRTQELNSVNANKLDIVMPFIVDTINRKITELQNQIQAVIQNNYTTLHPSVNWKFKNEAIKYIQSKNAGKEYHPHEIVFNEVYPLYGQIDIKDSSVTRNLSVKNDLSAQLKELISILEHLHQGNFVVIAEQYLTALKAFIDELSVGVKADTEQYIQSFLEVNIYPLIKQNDKFSKKIVERINRYFQNTHRLTGDFYSNRRNYETTLSLINEKLVSIIDNRQTEVQAYFPHYYERFKTDGVEHNLYIGSSIAPNKNFEIGHLQHLRFWQLRVLCEMEYEQYHLKKILPYALEVTSLLLVFSTPISIRFRMDEKHFDIDGAYNIRYEVIKKRIDKAYVKGTEERITEQGKITIIYSKIEEEQEYIKYIQILQENGVLDDTIEHLDVEDLQGVSGLKAIRVAVLYDKNLVANQTYSYDELQQLIN
jgi:hypothetical protein